MEGLGKHHTSGILDEELQLLKHKMKWLKDTQLAIPNLPEAKEAAMNFMSKIAEDLDLELEEI